MSSIHTSPRSNPAPTTPGQHATQEGLTQTQKDQLGVLRACVSTAKSVRDPGFYDFRDLSEAFEFASRFDDLSCPEFHECVFDLLASFIDLVHKCPADERSGKLSTFFDNGADARELPAIARLPFMTQSPFLENALDRLLQGNHVAIDVAFSLVGQLPVSDARAPNLIDRVLSAVSSSSPEPADLSHCVSLLSPFARVAGHGALAGRLAHMCLDRIEAALAKVEPGLRSHTMTLRKVLDIDPHTHAHAHSEVVSERLGRLLAQMVPAAAHLVLDSYLNPQHTHDIRLACFTLFKLPQLPAAWKAQAASAAIAQVPMTEVRKMLPSDQSFLIRACTFLPDESKGAWVKELLSLSSRGIQFGELLTTVRSMQPGENRERLLGMLRERLVAQCEDFTDRAPLPELIRLALTIGSGAEDRLAESLVLFAQIEVDHLLMNPQPCLHELDQLDEIAILSFHLDPDGQLAVPGTEVRDTGNARNPEKLTGGTPFTYPDWLVARRTVLQNARPAVNAKPAVDQHLPNYLAEIMQAYAVGRVIKVSDWEDLSDVLIRSRAQR